MRPEEKTTYVTPDLKTYEVKIHKVTCGTAEAYVKGSTVDWFDDDESTDDD